MRVVDRLGLELAVDPLDRRPQRPRVPTADCQQRTLEVSSDGWPDELRGVVVRTAQRRTRHRGDTSPLRQRLRDTIGSQLWPLEAIQRVSGPLGQFSRRRGSQANVRRPDPPRLLTGHCSRGWSSSPKRRTATPRPERDSPQQHRRHLPCPTRHQRHDRMIFPGGAGMVRVSRVVVDGRVRREAP